LAREADGAGDPTQASRHEVVEVAIRRGGQFQSSETDIIERLVVHAERFIRVLDQLMDRKRAIIRLNDGIRHLRRRHDGEGHHHAVRVLLADLRNNYTFRKRERCVLIKTKINSMLESQALQNLHSDNLIAKFSNF